MAEHGVALTVNCGAPFLMCACGWHERLTVVTTWEHAARLVDGHLTKVSTTG